MIIVKERSNLDEIKILPIRIDEIPDGATGVHESVCRAYNILELVKSMLERGDSKETILYIIGHLEFNSPEDTLKKIEEYKKKK